MTQKQLFTNNAVSLLVAPISPTDLTLTVLPGNGALFPTPQANEFFAVTLENQSATLREIVHVINRTGDVFTISRGQEGTTALAWSASTGNDTLVDHRITAAALYTLSNAYSNETFPGITDFAQALDYLLEGSPTSGQTVQDAEITTEVVLDTTVITTPTEYASGTTAVYVGGSRQKRGVDYIETTSTELQLQFVLTPEQIIAGQNVVVDYTVA